ncbi:phosphoribosyltransferase [Treponema lecithinolyticum]|uniref:Phosphoribosyl transferase domain protein n=1 Tax=Treponema lecithinolyticum ATCC 700332 TaxID=1321815 RepID=A0ABN0P491_TRELE|nr:phosphoribosyltransferase [Treponema lecithinolyticum]ERJ94588.1 phosphoribosyl transferase domain protein [Treponema lecithinolyticum ATCC 700332]
MKEFVSSDSIRNNALKMAHRILQDGFIPDVIYVSLRGGAYVANVLSEYFKLARKDVHPVLYAAVVARSYSDIRCHSRVMVDGWTYSPEHLRSGDRILLVDDIFDTGRTINHLVEILLEKGIPRKDIKVAVHDYKYFTDLKEQLPIQPDYWCRKFTQPNRDNDNWLHYLSHELVGLTAEEREKYYYSQDPDLREVLEPLFTESK